MIGHQSIQVFLCSAPLGERQRLQMRHHFGGHSEFTGQALFQYGSETVCPR